MKLFKTLFTLVLAAGCILTYGQVPWELDGNLVGPGDFIGSTNNEVFDVRQNDLLRARFRNVNWPGYNGSDSFDDASRIFFGIDGNDEVPFSMMHLGLNPPLNLQRPWMNVGTSYTAGADIMHVGLLQRPAGTSGFFGDLVVDAVVAWGCNAEAPIGPDNLRFLFLTPTNLTGPGSAPEGLETMRITPWGNVGIGADFNNDQQPHRRAVVHQRTDSAQFRISYELDPDPVEGTHADFQVSPSGNLHLRPRHDNEHRTVALGFLASEGVSDPINSGPVQTTLDVGGLTRVRNLPDTVPDCLITGFKAGTGGGNRDNFLTRLDFLEGEDADCFVLGAEGEWVDICGLSGEDADWQFNGLDVWTGVPSDDFPTRNVGIGTALPTAKLHIANSESYPSDPFWSRSLRVENTSSDIAGGIGIEVEMNSTNSINKGLSVTVNPGFPLNVPQIFQTAGEFRIIKNGTFVKSVDAFASAPGNNSAGIGILAGVYSVTDVSSTEGLGVQDEYGVYGETSCSGEFSAAIYGTIPNNPGTDCWAGYFNGPAFSTNFVEPSDEALKTNITEFDNALDMLIALEPKKYEFIPSELINLPSGQRYGLMAQNVQEIIPELVTNVATPSKLDTLGNVVADPLEFKAINYTGVIPILVAAFKEQAEATGELPGIVAQQEEEINALKDLVAEQAEQLDVMQDALQQAVATFETAKRDMDNCCNSKSPAAATAGSEGKVMLEQNYPNPFTSETRIEFYLPEDARIVLEISDAQGRKLHNLVEGQLSAGNHTATWDAGRYAPGIYYCSLYADGELLTKKMIKM